MTDKQTSWWLTASRVRGGSSSRGGRGGHRRRGGRAPPRGGRGALAPGPPRGGRGARAPPCRWAPARASPPAHGPSGRDGDAPCAPCTARGWCGARCGRGTQLLLPPPVAISIRLASTRRPAPTTRTAT